ncbi:piggyBac transposable element-derived protein 4-like [Melanaphis sacchari]|uniref:piggyBac transposable element-derived protein 4-like n=1 Tax=Melanaphis sacchari TaxID=742174 RepID=UPI000DC139EA|nr:piggyBac transposable element-derived protein 4-like [Melanaphis sacchari]
MSRIGGSLSSTNAAVNVLKHLSSKKVGACGTDKANRKGMPNLCKNLKRGECKLAITKKSKILAFKWKDKRDVLMLSTTHKHQMKKINKNDKLQIKPNCILDYNTNMGLVDKTDMTMSFNGTIRKSVKWYKNFFFSSIGYSNS